MNSVLLRRLKKVLVIIIGGTVLLIGIVFIILPGGPATLVIPAGLAILAIEFTWARTLLKRAKNMANTKIVSFLSGRGKTKKQDTQTHS